MAMLWAISAQSKTIKIAVIDTGFDFNSTWNTTSAMIHGLVKPKLCKTGHKDVTSKSIFKEAAIPQDEHGHGTHVAGILAKNLKRVDYCLIIIKSFKPKESGQQNLEYSRAALKHALSLNIDYVNYSGGGPEPDSIERRYIIKLLNKGVKIVAAAGNEKSKLVIKPYYPAMYDSRIYVAGSTDERGRILASSNRGYGVDKYLVGKNVMSLLPNNRVGPMTGTSQAAPLYLAEIIKGK